MFTFGEELQNDTVDGQETDLSGAKKVLYLSPAEIGKSIIAEM